ncbi:MAG: aminotransferase class III-fold pyridoxal phosphate-dependent enzyme [Lysobacter sp.]|nr:aminotransferase class III-fold pyridoxal phosphate-dependent enzyme [Lysobacter sp.]
MESTVEKVMQDILARRIGKEDAMKLYGGFSDEDRNRLVQSLRSLTVTDGAATQGQGGRKGGAAPRALKPIHEAHLDDVQKRFITELSARYATRTPTSKRNALEQQKHFVDQRKVAGLKRPLKSMQYQLTYARAEGAYLFDVDGNRYVDITGDNGVNFFGHQPEFMKDALRKRLDQGYPLVAYSEDLFESARRFCELTGYERMVYAQTGTEAVMWATRIARAATGKKKIVIFDGSYHGLSDTVFAMHGGDHHAVSAGPGLLQEYADQIYMVDYGAADSLAFIEEHASEIACVLIEPIQSRFPERRPVEFVRELRRITLERNIVFIFDEMVTGFRANRRGAQSFYKVVPDMSTYGKVPGGGMPTGIIAGQAKYLDYVDGGVYGFDDNSMPSLKRAVMAGTHTQNSLKVSAAVAVCKEMEKICPPTKACDYDTCDCEIGVLNRRTKDLCDELNAYFLARNLPLSLETFSSWFRIAFHEDPYGIVRELLILLLRDNGVETSTSGNNFLNLSHVDSDYRAVVDAFKRSLEALVDNGFFVEKIEEEADGGDVHVAAPLAPIPGAAPKAKAPEQAQPTSAELRDLVIAELRAVAAKSG